jgi:hypothetical protein
MLMWVGCDQVDAMTNAQLAYWHSIGVGGFVCETGWLWGVGGNEEFTPDLSADLSSPVFTIERQFVNSNVVARAHALGMTMYLGIYLSGYYNTQTPLDEWFGDGDWSSTVLPSATNFASSAHALGFDGIAFDEELYPGAGAAGTWLWNYPGNTHTQAQVRAEVTTRGSQLMGALVSGFPNLEIVDTATNFPGTWSAYVQSTVNGVVDPYGGDVQLDFWNGLTSVDGYSAIRFLDENFYKGPNVPGATFDAALSYNANSWFAVMSANFSNWAYAADRVFVSPFAWIDGSTVQPGTWADPRPPSFVAGQLTAYRKWGMGGVFGDYAGEALSAFDYTPYAAGIQAAAVPGPTADQRPSVSISGPTTAASYNAPGSTVSLSGAATDTMAIRDVTWVDDRGGSGSAQLTWQILGGGVAQGWQWQMDWSVATVSLQPGTNTITITAEDIGGLTSTTTLVVEAPGSTSGPPPTSAPTSTTTTAPSGPPSPPPGSPSTAPSRANPSGYWLVARDGGVFSFAAPFYGSTASLHLQRPIVDIAPTADGGGYWLVGNDGGVFGFGDAPFTGSIPGLGIAPAGAPPATRRLSAPIVGMVPTIDGHGYFLVGSDGGVFAFGDARFAGSCPSLAHGCDAPVVAVVPDATGNGYWIVTSTGSVYAFGDAPYEGGTAPQTVPATGAVRTAGQGYWILFANGQVASFGDAHPFGALTAGSTSANDPAVSIFATADGQGYGIVTAQGAVRAFGDASDEGDMSGAALNAPIVTATKS